MRCLWRMLTVTDSLYEASPMSDLLESASAESPTDIGVGNKTNSWCDLLRRSDTGHRVIVCNPAFLELSSWPPGLKYLNRGNAHLFHTLVSGINTDACIFSRISISTTRRRQPVMFNDKARFGLKCATIIFPLALQLISQRLLALVHRWTYRAVSAPKEIIVIGGSFTGVQIAQRLTETIPTGYRVTIIERKSHFNYLFNFPRYSVLAGHEEHAFIPYDMMESAAPKGSFRRIQNKVTSIKDGRVHLESGETIEFSYLVIATGSKQGLPSKGIATEKKDGCKELQTVQDNIHAANRIAVVGGGAVGVELAADIKSFHPEKDVIIVHSRERLLQRFGPRLHDHVVAKMRKMGIRVRLGERPEIMTEEKALLFPDGERQEYDLIVRFAFSKSENTF